MMTSRCRRSPVASLRWLRRRFASLAVPIILVLAFVIASAASAQEEPVSLVLTTSTTPRSPSVLGFVGSGKNTVLTRLDAKTLTPRPGAKRLRIGTFAQWWAFSRDGSRLALASPNAGVLIIDAAQLRVDQRLVGRPYRFGDHDMDPWEIAWAGRSTLVVIAGGSYAKGSLAYVWVDLPTRSDTGGIGSSTELLEPAIMWWERTPAGLAVLGNSGGDRSLLGLDLLIETGSDHLELHQLTAGAAALAVDAERNRLFVIPAAGGVAEVVRLSGRRSLSYHDLTLPPTAGGTAFGRWAAWLGSDTLALWGVNGDGASPSAAGLTLIDTSSWTARAIDPAITSAIGAPGVVLAWSAGSSTGVVTYTATGRTRFRALGGHQVRDSATSTRYAYVWADCTTPTGTESCSRFSVDLRSGQVTGPLRSRATPVVP